MAILTFDKLSQAFGAFDVFSELKGKIESDSKIGLVGPNGIGKTTFLQTLVGLKESTNGTISFGKGMTFGYLRQEAVLAFGDRENSLYNEMLLVFERVFDMERQMRRIEEGMADGSATDEDYEIYGELHEKCEFYGLYDYERRIERSLEGLGFDKENDWDKPIKILSGGQKTRALLAKLLLETPDLLILDEPTNHLDIEAVRWLEGTLQVWKGALLIVSHDRYFLDRVVNRIWEMSSYQIEEYKGNYSAYLMQRQERRDRIQIEWDSMMERFTKEYEFIKRMGLGDANAMGRFRRLTREVEVAGRHGIEGIRFITKNSWSAFTSMFERKQPPQTIRELEIAMKALKSPIQHQKGMRLKLIAEERSGEMVLRGRNLTIGYDKDKPLFTSDDIDLNRQEVAALIGANGTGKSSLLKTLLDQMKPLKGYFNFGVNLETGYFAQAHDTLNPEHTVLEELMSHKSNLGIAAARQHLAPYLFTGEDVYKQVSTLSGGERGRLALAILALKKANLLLLDEPTNHLDIPAQEVLQDVLEDFDGTIIMVSHDRFLVDRLATQIWDLEDGHLRVFKGSYSKYLEVLEQERANQPVKSKSKAKVAETLSPEAKQVQRVEAQIIALEGEIKELEKLLSHASAAGNSETIVMLNKQHKAQQARLHELNMEWEEMTAVV
jgi:ATP-binding cassette, subfamily F, member 3